MNVTELFGQDLDIEERDRVMEELENLIDFLNEMYDETNKKEILFIVELLERSYAILQESIN